MPTPPNTGLRNLQDATNVAPQQGGLRPLMAPTLRNVPAGYTSPDVIDRRQGQSPTLMDIVRDRVANVRQDYTSSGELPGNPYGPSSVPISSSPYAAASSLPMGTDAATMQIAPRRVVR